MPTITEHGITIHADDRLQPRIDNGQAWQSSDEGRTAMRAIEAGHAILGRESFHGPDGKIIPSREEVFPGTLGSIEYAHQLQTRLEWGV